MPDSGCGRTGPSRHSRPSKPGASTSDYGRNDSSEPQWRKAALLDRQEPKDLADIWGFVVRLGLPLEAAITEAQSKAAGIFVPDLARVLLTASTADWTRIQWDNGPDPPTFVSDLHRIGESLLLPNAR